MPCGDVETRSTTVLIVSADDTLIESLERSLASKGFRVLIARNGWEAAVQADSVPDATIVDFAIGEVEAKKICETLSATDDLVDKAFVSLLPPNCRLPENLFHESRRTERLDIDDLVILLRNLTKIEETAETIA